MKAKRFMTEYVNYIEKTYGEKHRLHHIVIMYTMGLLTVNETMGELTRIAQEMEFDKIYGVKNSETEVEK